MKTSHSSSWSPGRAHDDVVQVHPVGPVRWAPPTRMPARLSFRRLPETRTPLEATTSTACCVLSVITFCEPIVLELISISIPTVCR